MGKELRNFLNYRTFQVFLRSPIAEKLFFVVAITCVGRLFLTNNYYQIQASIIWLMIPLGMLIAFAGGDYRPLRSNIIVLIGAYLLVILVATAFNPSVEADWVSTTIRSKDFESVFVSSIFLSLLIVSLTAVISILAARTKGFVTASIAVVGALAAVAALVNIFIYLAEMPENVLIQYYRLKAVIGMPHYGHTTNISATYAILGVGAVGVMVAPKISTWLRGGLLLTAATLFAGVALTQSRGSMVAVLCGVATVGASATRTVRSLLAIGGLICVAVVLLDPQLLSAITARGLSRRPELWQLYLSLAEQSPWTGYGGFAPIEVVLADGFVITQPHNLVLSGLVRGGIFGALAMLLLLASCLWWAARYRQATGNAGPLGAIVALTVAGMVDYQLVITRPDWVWITFWFPIALCASAEVTVRRAQLRNTE